MLYQVSATVPTRVLQKTAYFPGWKVFANATEIPIAHETPEYPGRIAFILPPGKHDIEVVFTNQTPARHAADTATVLGFGLFVILLLPAEVWKRASGILPLHRGR